MAHIIVPEAEAILDKEFPVLDKGFVRLVDYLGGDQRIVQAARVSYGDGTKTIRQDKGLIEYLISHQHTSPFEQVILTFHCKMPVFIARQWIRHRTARLNEISGRYSVMADEFYIPEKDQVLYQSKSNRQGRAGDEVPDQIKQKVLDILTDGQNLAYREYEKMINEGIARELSRINLPLSLYTQWYWQIDLSNLFHFLKLRMDYHAQWEIRQYANAMADITKAVAPLAYKAFETHVLNAVSFSGAELAALRRQLEGKNHGLTGIHKTEYEAKLDKIKQSQSK